MPTLLAQIVNDDGSVDFIPVTGIAGTDGIAALSMALNGTVVAVTGTLKPHIMNPGDLALVGNETGEIIWHGTCKMAWVVPIGAVGGASILWASSTAASDGANLAGDLNAADGEIDTPTGASIAGVNVITPQEKEYQATVWDGTNTIKTVAIRASQAAFTGKCVLYTVE